MIEDPIFFKETKATSQMSQKNLCVDDMSSNYKMVVIVRNDLKMGTGKIAAQVGHGGKKKNGIFIFFSPWSL
jgi:hypothetical protein